MPATSSNGLRRVKCPRTRIGTARANGTAPKPSIAKPVSEIVPADSGPEDGKDAWLHTGPDIAGGLVLHAA